MNKNIIVSGAAAFVALIAISGFAYNSYASNNRADGEYMRGQGGFGSAISDEARAELEAGREARRAEAEDRRTAMQEAIGQDFGAWKALVVEHRGEDAQVLEVINEDNFDKFKQAHDKIWSGQDLIEEGRAELEELGVERQGMGLGTGMKNGSKMGHGRGMGMHMDFGGETPQVQ